MESTQTSPEQVIEQLLEWHLCEALKKQGPNDFWAWPAVHLLEDPVKHRFSELFARDAAPEFVDQKGFSIDDAKLFGLDKDQFKRTLWTLRPDFAFKGESLM